MIFFPDLTNEFFLGLSIWKDINFPISTRKEIPTREHNSQATGNREDLVFRKSFSNMNKIDYVVHREQPTKGQ